MAVKFSNNGKTTLASNITSSATSISVTDGSVFPTLSGGDTFFMTLEDISGNIEIVSVTARSGNTLTVTRAQEGTTARAFSSSDKAENRLTAAGLNSFVSDSGDTIDGGDLTVNGEYSDNVFMVDYSSGRVGVNLGAGNTPSNALHINGTVQFSGAGSNSGYQTTVTTYSSSTTFYRANGDLSFVAGSMSYPKLTLTNAGALTYGGSTVWHAGNDGTGSGLDADTVDGVQGSSFLRSDAFDTSSSGLYLQGGSYSAGTDTVTAPLVIDEGDYIYTKDGGYLRKLIGKGDTTASSDTIEIGQSGTSLIKLIDLIPGVAGNSAVKVNGNTVWNAGNDGSNSGLDADTLDGLHGYEYHRAENKLNWTRVGHGDSGTAYWHKLAEIITDGNYHGYLLRCDWTSRYTHGELSMMISSSNSTTAIVEDAHVKVFGETRTKSINHFKYYKSGSTVQVWVKTSGWEEFDYIRRDAVTNGEPDITWYTESTTTQQTSEPSSLTTFTDHSPWSPVNDGSGSGLDADLLDGIQASSFLRSDADDTLSGTYLFSRTTTAPAIDISGHAGASSYNYFLRARNDGGNRAVMFVNGSTRSADGGPNAVTIRNDGGPLILGHASNSTKLIGTGDLTYNGNEIWHSGNDGSGSGLDADTVDGLQASQFLRSDANDTTSGTLTITGGEVLVDKVRCNTGQQLVLNAGEANGVATGQTSELVYMNAEDGVQINSSTDNWGGGWSNRRTATITGTRITVDGNYWEADDNAWNKFYTTYGYIQLGPANASWAHIYTDRPGFYFNKTNLQTLGNVIWHAGNDGSGSGLDADLLDGIQASSFLRSDAADTSTGKITFNGGLESQAIFLSGAQNFDTFKTSGFYSLYNVDASGHTNAPFRYGAMMTAGNTAVGGGMAMQIAHERTGAGTYIRGMNDSNDTWYAWKEIWTSGTDGSGSGLDADLLDGIQASSFLRSDADDTVGAGVTYTWSATDTAGLKFVNSSYNTSLEIGGWTTANSSNISRIRNSSGNLHIDSASNGNLYLNHYSSGNVYIRGSTAWHGGNDGSGSGLDADTVDGYHASTTRNAANTIPIRDGNGYLQLGWINTTSGDNGTNIPDRIYASSDSYVRYYDLASFRSFMNVTAKTGYQGREQSTTDSNYWVGSMGWGTTTFDNLFKYGSGDIDTWSSPSDQPSGTTHWVGSQHLHYHNGSTSGYGHQIVVGAGNPSLMYVRGKWGTQAWSAWNKMWNAANDGSGSGLDADTVDGLHASSFEPASATIIHQGSDIGSQDWNTFIDGTEASWNTVVNMTGSNKPPNYTYGQSLSISKSSQAKFQLYASHTASAGNGLYYRSGWSTDYKSWAEIWDSNNDGSGSGLDADTVDGVQASSFWQNSNNPSSQSTTGYQKLASGIIIQYGFIDTTSQIATHYFSTSFPTACRSVVITGDLNATKYASQVTAVYTNRFTYRVGSNYSSSNDLYYIAIGY